jgi:hypothetical protein
VYSKALADPQFFRLFFEAACQAQPARFSGVVAVVFCTMQTIFRAVAPTIIPNSYTRYQVCLEKAIDVLITQFGGTLISDN